MRSCVPTKGRQAGLFCTACLAGILFGLSAPVQAVTFSEPHTVFYGKVLGTGSEQPFLIREGDIQWTIHRSDGTRVTYRTTLYPYHDGTFTYQLQVPHSAFALGLEPDENDGIPLLPSADTHVHAEVLLDGESATLLGPAGASFTTRQLTRTATYRMDLAVGRKALDTDGDGIADWWEDLYGLDKQDASDAGVDMRGDGLSALDAYRRGLDPTRDATEPAVLTSEQIVYPAGSTALVLDTADLDSDPEQLTYTVDALHLAGQLRYRNARLDPDQPDAQLVQGDTFSHADLLQGRVLYEHAGSDADPGWFGISVRDEHPEHAAYQTDIRLLAYRPAEAVPVTLTMLEARRLMQHNYAQMGYVVFDTSVLPEHTAVANPSAGLEGADLADYIAMYGEDRPYLFAGGGASSVISGGHRDDMLLAVSNGGTVSGGAGADSFVFEDFQGGTVTISDFRPAMGDAILLPGLEGVEGAYLDDYIELAPTEQGYALRVAAEGPGSGYTNLTVHLPGLPSADADLYALSMGGHLSAGNLRLEPRFKILAPSARASQSGPTAGRFRIVREGDLASDLTLQLLLSGTAENGTDYVMIQPSVDFAAGVDSVDLEVMPYVTGYQGPEKTVHGQLVDGDAYRLHTDNSALITIQNLAMVVELDVLDDLAVVDGADSGWIRVRRRYVTEGDALIRFTVGGTAVEGVDYETLPGFVYLDPQQTSALIEIQPKPDATWSEDAKSIRVTVLPDEDYLVREDAGTANVTLMSGHDTLAAWRQRWFEGQDEDLVTFAGATSGYRTLTHLQYYAFGIDPEQPDVSGLPQVVALQGESFLTFRKPPRVAGDVTYRVRGFRDLMHPAETALPVEETPAPDETFAPDRVYYRVSEPVIGPVFWAVEVEWVP